MSNQPNSKIFDTYVKTLTDGGVPQEVAEQASEVVAKDDPTAENLGRTAEDQEKVNEALDYIHGGKNESK